MAQNITALKYPLEEKSGKIGFAWRELIIGLS